MITQELLFQFIWQYSLYRSDQLCTLLGEPVCVQFQGKRNHLSGPDFEAAKIRIGTTLLVGHVELHLKTSDWFKHGHQHDRAYDSVILHVVWENDMPIVAQTHLPILEMRHHIAADVIRQYESLQYSVRQIPCAPYLTQVNELTKEAWLTRLLAERWEMKSLEWHQLLAQNAEDWRVLLYWQLAANFGFKTNAAAFLALAQSLPLNILARHHKHLFQIEALLFGQAGMLEQDFQDDYPFRLQQEYRYLRKKYKLQGIPAHRWRFMRLRPANFPTIRIAQFAALVHRSVHLFTQIIASVSLAELLTLFEVKASDYWDTHFRFDELQKGNAEKHLGSSSVQNIIINTIAPLRFFYAMRTGLGDQAESSVQLLEQVPAESNNIMNAWEKVQWTAKNAAQSQALIQLFNYYCSDKQCLQCSIGHRILQLRP
jgi:hypothetical protein